MAKATFKNRRIAIEPWNPPLNPQYARIAPFLLRELERLRPAIDDAVKYITEQRGRHMHPDDYDVIFRLASDELRRVTNDYAFELRVFLAAKGKRAKLVLELLDSHGWAQSIDPQQPLAPMIGFIHLPPYDCTGMKDITVPSA